MQLNANNVKEGGDNVMLISLVPKFYNNVSLFVDLTILGTLVNFDWLIYLVMCPTVSTTNFYL